MIKKLKESIKKYKIIYNFLIFMYSLLRIIYYYIFLLFFSIFKINNKKIIIINFNGKGYGDTGKYISQELDKQKYDIYWAAKEEYKNSIPKEINYVKINSIRYLYHLATAKIWINNVRFEYGVRKRKKQFYIQTRHGCFALKKVESAVVNDFSTYALMAKNDSKMANVFISNSTFCTNFYRKYFWYNGAILEYGCPRNDIVINKNKNSIEIVRKHFGILASEKICLYAPTFRINNSLNVYNINYDVLIKGLRFRFNNNWKILIRLHPSMSYLSNQLAGIGKDIINATDYPDMQELLVAADFLITDYSSCIFDYALSGKPAIIYASDIEEYKKDRNFEIKLEDTPFLIATNNNELKNIIQNYDIDKYGKKLDKFYNDMGLNETGKSCKKIVQIINAVSMDKELKYN